MSAATINGQTFTLQALFDRATYDIDHYQREWYAWTYEDIPARSAQRMTSGALLGCVVVWAFVSVACADMTVRSCCSSRSTA